uniref:Uncharacterized protein n=1 Tax=Photinus pyralis TaxID=7054 RepID=A0A1Y1JUM4_PHOPY
MRSRSPRRRSRSRSRSFSLSRSFSPSPRTSPPRHFSPKRSPHRGPHRYRSPVRSPPRYRFKDTAISERERGRDRDLDRERDRDKEFRDRDTNYNRDRERDFRERDHRDYGYGGYDRDRQRGRQQWNQSLQRKDYVPPDNYYHAQEMAAQPPPFVQSNRYFLLSYILNMFYYCPGSFKEVLVKIIASIFTSSCLIILIRTNQVTKQSVNTILQCNKLL